MTANQSSSIIKNPNTKKAIAALQKFAELETQYKAAEKEAKAAKELIKEAMIEAGIPKLDDLKLPGFTGFITLAERTNYRAEEGVLDDLWQEVLSLLLKLPQIDGVGFTNKLKHIKLALDTDKVKAEAVLTGKLPAGVVESKTQYIIPKFKVEK